MTHYRILAASGEDFGFNGPIYLVIRGTEHVAIFSSLGQAKHYVSLREKEQPNGSQTHT